MSKRTKIGTGDGGSRFRSFPTSSPRAHSRSACRPSLLGHLALSLLFLTVPSLLSTELTDIRRSRHFTFFLEPGFWARESAVALLSLGGLSAFWHLASVRPFPLLSHGPRSRGPALTPPHPSRAQTLDPLPTLALVALKDRLVLPQAYHTLLGNPLDGLSLGTALLSERQQIAALVLLGAWAVVQAVREEGADERGARQGARRKER